MADFRQWKAASFQDCILWNTYETQCLKYVDKILNENEWKCATIIHVHSIYFYGKWWEKVFLAKIYNEKYAYEVTYLPSNES